MTSLLLVGIPRNSVRDRIAKPQAPAHCCSGSVIALIFHSLPVPLLETDPTLFYKVTYSRQPRSRTPSVYPPYSTNQPQSLCGVISAGCCLSFSHTRPKCKTHTFGFVILPSQHVYLRPLFFSSLLLSVGERGALSSGDIYNNNRG